MSKRQANLVILGTILFTSFVVTFPFILELSKNPSQTDNLQFPQMQDEHIETIQDTLPVNLPLESDQDDNLSQTNNPVEQLETNINTNLPNNNPQPTPDAEVILGEGRGDYDTMIGGYDI